MKDESTKAVEALREKIRGKEEEIRQLKNIINGFFTDEGEDPPYVNVHAESRASGSLRSDMFYNKTLAEATQVYLEMRKSSGHGSASVNDIYAALKTGGYAFETKNDDYAKNGVRISLRKNPTIFHQLPGGDYGLCLWYGVKGKEQSKPAKKRKKRAKAESAIAPEPAVREANGQHPAKGARRAPVKLLV